MSGLLASILERKRREIARRARRGVPFGGLAGASKARRPVIEILRRPLRHGLPQIIAEVKFRSPSAGQIRPWAPGEGTRIAERYADSGAAAISVLCDGPGFGGSVLELRRVARAVEKPVLFKEFVLDTIQVDLAAAVGASMVLLLATALDDATLGSLVDHCFERGLEPIVEAASAAELERALATRARVIGINARDLSSFVVDPRRAADLVEKIPKERVAVYMSGVSDADDLRRIARGRADAVLVGSGLMRAHDPGRRLAELLAEASG